jgi:antitoxin StbD
VPADVYEAMLEKLDDMTLVDLVKKRQNQPEIEVSFDEL